MVKILLVDDELEFCKSLEKILIKEGYEVIIANSGIEAIDKVKTDRPQIILLDIRMPQMDGIQTLEGIKQIDKEAVIMMVTVESDREVAKRAIKLGAVNYIIKPIDLTLLRRSLQGWAMQIEARHLGDFDILALEYNEEKLKTILDIFTKKGYNIKIIENKSSELDVTKGPFDLLVLRVDILGDDAVRLLARYKEMYPELPVIITLGTASPPELVDKIKKYGYWQYLPGFFNTYGFILIAFGMVSRSKEKREIREEKKPSDYILIVDDEPEVCEYTASFLAKEGYRVHSVSNPKAVLDRIEALKPAIVLLDIVMPDVDGLELLKAIKRMNPKTKVIMMTGVKDESVCREALELGASDYIVKPFSLEQLKTTVFTNGIKAHLK